MRSSWKLKNFYPLFSAFNGFKKRFNLPIKRNYYLSTSLLKRKISIYNGKKMISFIVRKKKLPFLAGAFSWTKLWGRKVQRKYFLKKNATKKKKK